MNVNIQLTEENLKQVLALQEKWETLKSAEQVLLWALRFAYTASSYMTVKEEEKRSYTQATLVVPIELPTLNPGIERMTPINLPGLEPGTIEMFPIKTPLIDIGGIDPSDNLGGIGGGIEGKF